MLFVVFIFPQKNDFVVKRAFKQDQIVHMDGKFQVIRYFSRECTVAEVIIIPSSIVHSNELKRGKIPIKINVFLNFFLHSGSPSATLHWKNYPKALILASAANCVLSYHQNVLFSAFYSSSF